MPLLVNDKWTNAMVDAARLRGWDVPALGIEDADQLEELTDVLGVDGNEWIIGVEWSNCVGWFWKTGSGWSIVAISPHHGKTLYKRDELFGTKFGDEWLTKWRALDTMRAEAPTDTQVGDPVACRCFDNSGMIGEATEVDDKGKVLRVRLEPGGPSLDAASFAKRWFKLENRNEAFNWFWRNRETRFTAYINMLSQFARKQKKLTGSSKPAPKPVAAVAPKPVQLVEPIKERVSEEEEREAIFTHPTNRTPRQKAIVRAFHLRPSPAIEENENSSNEALDD